MRHLVSRALFGAATAATAACAAAPPAAVAPERTHIIPAGWESSYDEYRYSPVVRVGDTVYVSGIPASQGADDEAKLRWMFTQLEVHLTAAGATLADVVELESFHAVGDPERFRAQFDLMRKVHAEVFPNRYPAWTAVGTTALLAPGAIAELRAVAVVGSGRAPAVVRGAQPGR